ncbi:MAG: hypothetical protein QNJ54_06745 [Prochloraceae cyanobacterium]|nr:hypothetical protein [Prochloraceae cyanobacterium]
MPRLPIATELFTLQVKPDLEVYQALEQYQGADLEQLIVSDLVISNAIEFPINFTISLERDGTTTNLLTNGVVDGNNIYTYPTILSLRKLDKIKVSINGVREEINLNNSWLNGGIENWINLDWTVRNIRDELTANPDLEVGTGYLNLSIKTV